MYEDMSSDLMDRLLYILMEKEVPDLSVIKSRFAMILNDYAIEPKETALTVYTEGKNEYYMKRFLLAKATAGLTKRTLELYARNLQLSFGEIGKDADTITGYDLQIYMAKLMQRMTPEGAKNKYLTLSSFFTWAQNEELILKNPIKKVEPPKLRKKKKPAFTDMDIELLRNACRTNREKAIIETLLSTGCRASELVSIKISDIDGNAVEILGKGQKYRTVYLNAKALVAIKSYLAERKDENPFLFPRAADRLRETAQFSKMRGRKDWYTDPGLIDPLEHMDSSSSLNGVLKSIAKRAGVDNCHAHRFRRTCATFALRRGMPVEQVSKMLGHESIGTTQVYLDLTERDLELAHEKYVV